jgi:hypothetical protein
VMVGEISPSPSALTSLASAGLCCNLQATSRKLHVYEMKYTNLRRTYLEVSTYYYEDESSGSPSRRST